MSWQACFTSGIVKEQQNCFPYFARRYPPVAINVNRYVNQQSVQIIDGGMVIDSSTWRIQMPEWAWIIVFVVAYLAVTQWLLPKLGVPT